MGSALPRTVAAGAREYAGWDYTFGNRRIDLGQAVKGPLAEPAKKPAFDNADASLDLRLVPGLPRPGRQYRHPVMAGHAGVAAVDHGVEVAGPDHRDLGIIGHQKLRSATKEGEGRIMTLNPVGQLFRPGRTRE